MSRIETVTPGGFSMRFFRFGKGTRVLAILPGLSVQSVMGLADAVEESYRLLTDDFTLYVFDRREHVPAAYSMQDMARDTEEVFDALGLKHMSVFGASQGGMLAMQIALDRPDLMDKLMLGSTTAHMTEQRFYLIEKWIALAKEGRAEDLYLSFGQAIYPQDMFDQSRQALMEAAAAVTGEELSRFVILAESMKGFDVRDKLHELDCPVLVIGDDSDEVLGADASLQLADHLGARPGVELSRYSGYGHAVYDTAPDCRERMLRFLTT